MKFFALVNNQYLSDKQCGIQTSHAVSEMSMAYNHDTPQNDAYEEWALEHKTLIMARGGNCVTLEQHYEQLVKLAKPLELPVTRFEEDETLNYALTAIGIVMPTDSSRYTTKKLRTKYEALTEFTNQFHLV